MDNPLLRPLSRQISRSSGNFAIFASLFVIVSVLVLIPVLVVVLHDSTVPTTTTIIPTITIAPSITASTTIVPTTGTTTTTASTTPPSIISLVDGVSNRVDYDSIDDSFVFAEYEVVSPSDVQLRVKKKERCDKQFKRRKFIFADASYHMKFSCSLCTFLPCAAVQA
jgi:hypothetical protein